MFNKVHERRQSSRLFLNRLVIVKEQSGDIHKLVGVNFSTGGIAVKSKKPLLSGELVNLLFWLTEPENKEVNMTAKVLHYAKQGDDYTNSLQFIDELPVH